MNRIWGLIFSLLNLYAVSISTLAPNNSNKIIKNNFKNIINCKATSYCDNMEACSSNGICYVDIFSYYNVTNTNRNTSCICNVGWISVEGYDVSCCYQQKQQAIAFLLEFIFGFGAGHWYVGNKTRGLIKTIFSSTLCAVICATSFFMLYKLADYESISLDEKKYESSNVIKKKNRNIVPVLLMVGSIICYFIWQLIDVVLFGINHYTDGNGQQLQGW
jgi:hypothetical protein